MRRGSVPRILVVARLTLREALRRRIVVAALVMSGGFLLLYGLGLHYVAVEMAAARGSGAEELIRRAAAAQMLYLGLFPAAMLVALAAVFAGSGSVSADVDSGVAYAVLARPVRRGEIVLGKFIGLAAMLALYALILDGAIVGLARWQLRTPVADWPGALALMALEPVTLLALALLGSTRLPTLANGVLCSAAYAIAFVGGFIEQMGALISNPTAVQLGIVASLLMPIDAVHRKAISMLIPGGLLFGQGAIGLGLGESSTPSVWMIAYAAGYVVVLTALAGRVFQRRDL